MKLRKNRLKVLGAYGGKYGRMHPSTFLINENICIDGGHIIDPLQDDIFKVEHIFLTHSHFDHISDIPYLLDLTFARREKPLFIYGLNETIRSLKDYLFNQKIWPDFYNIKLPDSKHISLQFVEISFFEEYSIEDITIKPVPAEHTVPTAGFILNDQILISGDTASIDDLTGIIRKIPGLKTLFVDISFPEKMEEMAYISKHHSTKTIRNVLEKINSNVNVYGYHLKPLYVRDIKEELKDEDIYFLKEGEVFYFL
ncbi:MBL fold metallo-hydrolase [Persephonella sp.]